MPVCSYLVFPRPGASGLAGRLATLPGCLVTPAENAEVLILVTETADETADEELRDTLRLEDDIQCLVLTFGEVDQDPGPRARWNRNCQKGHATAHRRGR